MSHDCVVGGYALFATDVACSSIFGSAFDEVSVHKGISTNKPSTIVGWTLSPLRLCVYETRCAPTLLGMPFDANNEVPLRRFI